MILATVFAVSDLPLESNPFLKKFPIMSRVSFHDLGLQEARLRHQRRMSSISSVLIAFLVLALLMLILAFILLPSLRKDTTPLVSYAGPPAQEEEIQQKTMSQMKAKPSAPSSSAAKAIAANVASPTAIPVPEIDVTELSPDFGVGNDLGQGWAEGTIDGMGGGGTTFFRQKVSAQRMCYVIDYSQSMRGKRDPLMREELTKSVKQIGPGVQFQMIFFAGPAWVAGSEVKMQNNKTATVTHKGKGYDWKTTGGAHSWEPVGKELQPEWLAGGGSEVVKALDHVKKTKLVWGTDWEDALEMALGMDPAPQIIFFMTDGVTGGNMVKLAEDLGRKAKRQGTIINTVAMMQPNAEEAMKELAKRTGGQFTIVRPGGESELIPLD